MLNNLGCLGLVGFVAWRFKHRFRDGFRAFELQLYKCQPSRKPYSVRSRKVFPAANFASPMFPEALASSIATLASGFGLEMQVYCRVWGLPVHPVACRCFTGFTSFLILY